MKMKTLIALVVMSVSTLAFAHGTKLGMTKLAVDAGIDQFEKDLPARVIEFVAVKAWPDGNAIQVKFTLTNAQTTDFVQYHCVEVEHPDGSETWECHKL